MAAAQAARGNADTSGEPGHLFSEQEQAALALTEAVTLLTNGSVPDEVYDGAAKHFEAAELAHLISLIAAINAYNRINVTVRAKAGFYRPGMLDQ